MAGIAGYTWDGLPIAPDEPHGAAIMVRRPSRRSTDCEYLVLHRAHRGPDYAGDWAWTPPSGSRQPGESVLAAALRELSEEAGIQAAGGDLRVLDLGGPWARFALDVPPGTPVRLDAEHDAFDWLSASAAIARCHPAAVADGVRAAEHALAAAISFRALTMADLPDLVTWMDAPHAARWFPERLDLAAARRKYGPRIDGNSPTKVHVAIADGLAFGFAQHYRVGDYPQYAAAAGAPDAIGIDYLIGIQAMTARGLGPQLIWSYLRDVALPGHPTARRAIASPDRANERSIRALEKAGFAQTGDISMADGPGVERLCVLDLIKFFEGTGSA